MQSIGFKPPKEFFIAVDTAFGEALAPKSEEQAFFLSYLLKAAREGHLCVKITEETIEPILDGLDTLPDARAKLLAGANHYSGEAVIRYGSLYYLQRNWIKETVCLEEFTRLLRSTPDFVPSIANVNLTQLQPEQALAIQTCMQSSIFILTGGPGTGKTYTAGQMIKTLVDGLSDEQKCKFEIVLAAPTGKAAANLKKSISTALNNEDLNAETLHSLLKIYKKSREETLTADLIIVDECSMIDTNVMAALLKAVKPGARLIMLGDKYQLPSVDVGSAFSNMVDFIQGSDEYKSRCVALKKCMRAELKGIVQFAEQIKAGVLEPTQEFEGIQRLSIDQFHSNPKRFVEWIAPQFKTHGFSQFRVLSPMRRGPWGIDALNKQIYTYLQKRHTSIGPMEIPIMITKNHEETGLYNGDVGILRTRNDALENRFDENDIAIIDDQEIPAILLPSFDLAYCISIHKSQGSEFPKIVLILPEGSEQFGREVFYTAVTRARRSIDFIASYTTVQATLARPSLRLSGLPQRLALKQKPRAAV